MLTLDGAKNVPDEVEILLKVKGYKEFVEMIDYFTQAHGKFFVVFRYEADWISVFDFLTLEENKFLSAQKAKIIFGNTLKCVTKLLSLGLSHNDIKGIVL
jgi:hypothetical protein